MVPIFKLDIEGLESFDSPMVVIKDISTSLKSFEIKEVQIEDISRKMRRIMLVQGVPPKSGMKKTLTRARFHVSSDVKSLKEKYPEGKLLGAVPLTDKVSLYVYREQK